MMIFRLSLVLAVLLSLAFTPDGAYKRFETTATAGEVVATVPDSLASTSSFYSFRRDLRKCASPRCGGYFVTLGNDTRTRCADNRWGSECYVASIEWNGQAEPESDRALLRGAMRLQGNRNGRLGVLRGREVWGAASAREPSGTFFRVRDRGIKCIAAPCPTHHEAKLNTTQSREIAGVDLSSAGAPENLLSEATQGMTSTDG